MKKIKFYKVYLTYLIKKKIDNNKNKKFIQQKKKKKIWPQD